MLNGMWKKCAPDYSIMKRIINDVIKSAVEIVDESQREDTMYTLSINKFIDKTEKKILQSLH